MFSAANKSDVQDAINSGVDAVEKGADVAQDACATVTGSIKDAASVIADSIKTKVSGAGCACGEKAKLIKQKAEVQVRQKPLASVLGAAGLGALTGVLVSKAVNKKAG